MRAAEAAAAGSVGEGVGNAMEDDGEVVEGGIDAMVVEEKREMG